MANMILLGPYEYLALQRVLETLGLSWEAHQDTAGRCMFSTVLKVLNLQCSSQERLDFHLVSNHFAQKSNIELLQSFQEYCGSVFHMK